ncbi:Unknown (Phop36) [Spodoptera exigua multiple nucleopolyhedrovirus]|nr:Unknown (Phop36) [Spodoptera exigua multiple nucleopolyhedrovirus]CDG73064.1 Unknown (Phop36) [Spodoptera exigua multiple nucleopolyhedrovirus]
MSRFAKVGIIYLSEKFDENAKLVLFSQRLIQDNEQESNRVLCDLASKGYSLCVVADRREIIIKTHPVTNKKIKIDVSDKYITKMKKTLIKWNHPVKFAKFDEFKGYKYDIDTDDWDRIDYSGPYEETIKGSGKMVPKYVRNDYIVNYYKKLI